MSERYHINPETGQPNKCNAQIKCRFGSDAPHYATKDEARAGFEAKQGEQTVALSKPKTRKKIVAVNHASKDLSQWAGKLPNLPDGRTFEAAWEEKFKNFYDFKTEHGEDVKPGGFLRDCDSLLVTPVYAIRESGQHFITAADYESETYDGAANGEDYILVVQARQGGGNRECWCDDEENHKDSCTSANNEELEAHPNYLSDRDDYGDATYANFYFANGITKTQVEEYYAEKQRLLDLRTMETSVDQVKDGKLTPWAALANGEDVNGALSTYINTTNSLNRLKNNADRAEASNAKLDNIIKKSADGTVVAEDLDGLSIATWDRRYIVDYSKAYLRKLEELKTVQGRYDEAEALPDGLLKEYLLGDRGTRTYQTTEKKGRRNVPVTKSYEMGSVLGEELKEAKRSTESQKTSLDRALESVVKAKTGNDNELKLYNEAKDSIPAYRAEAWSAGWYGDPRDIPEIPEDY